MSPKTLSYGWFVSNAKPRIRVLHNLVVTLNRSVLTGGRVM